MNGAPVPLHGEIARLPWRVTIEVDSPEVVRVRLDVETVRTPLRLSKHLTLNRGRAVLEIEEALMNVLLDPIDVMWGHHPTFGAPFLDESC